MSKTVTGAVINIMLQAKMIDKGMDAEGIEYYVEVVLDAIADRVAKKLRGNDQDMLRKSG